MFSESCPPLPWDKENNYTREAVELYYEVCPCCYIYLFFTFDAFLDIDFMSKELALSRAFCIIALSSIIKKFHQLLTSLCDSQAETNFSNDLYIYIYVCMYVCIHIFDQKRR